MEELCRTEISSRRRVNLSQTSKGIITYDLTIELMNKTNDEVIQEVMDLKEKIEKVLKQPQF